MSTTLEVSLEVVIVENNSLRGEVERYIDTIEWCKNIKYIYLEDCRNANVARNAGARASLGKYIAFWMQMTYGTKTTLRAKLILLKQKNGKAVFLGLSLIEEIKGQLKSDLMMCVYLKIVLISLGKKFWICSNLVFCSG